MLTFEPLDRAHADELYPEFAEEESFRYTAGKAPTSLQALRDDFAGLCTGPAPGSDETWMNWVVREAPAGHLVGALQATIFNDDTLWIGYRIVRSASGRGIATAGVQWLLSELGRRYPGRVALASVDTRNAPSVRVMNKCGFSLVRTEPAQIRGERTLDHIFRYVLQPA